MKIDIKTSYDKQTCVIYQKTYFKDEFLSDIGSQTTLKIIETEEKGIRDALICLGWTPPDNNIDEK